MIEDSGSPISASSDPGSRSSVMVIPLLALAGAVVADFVLAKKVGIALGFDVLVQLMLYASVQSGIGYWVGWKMFRSGSVLALWHVFGVLVSGALAGSLYLCAQLFVGGRNMPSSDSGWAVSFNIVVGLLSAFYLAVRLSTPSKSSIS